MLPVTIFVHVLLISKHLLEKMAEGRLTNEQRVQLSVAISANSMVKIALAYLNLSDADVKNIQNDEKGNSEAQNREILKAWSYRNPDNQVQVN